MAGHAFHRADVTVTDTVTVIGDAAIGLSTVEVAKAAGARNVALIGHHENALEIGNNVGADIGINSATSDEVEAILDFTDGEGCEVVFETVGGSTNTMESAAKMVKPGGKIVVLGIFYALSRFQESYPDFLFIAPFSENGQSMN